MLALVSAAAAFAGGVDPVGMVPYRYVMLLLGPPVAVLVAMACDLGGPRPVLGLLVVVLPLAGLLAGQGAAGYVGGLVHSHRCSRY